MPERPPASKSLLISPGIWLRIAAATGALGVILGAFGAHGLEGHVTAERLEVWKTATFYQLIHVPALIFLCVLPRFLAAAAWLFLFGILIFSGSLYLLVILDQGWLGAVTPIGGSSLILAWLWLAVRAPAALRSRAD